MNNNDLEIVLTKAIHKESYYEFYKEAFAQLHSGDEYDENWHAPYLCDQLQKEFDRIMVRKEVRDKDLIINMPFRSSKSLITTVIFPVWCWTQDPKTKFICVSFSKDLALEHAQYSRDIINSVWFQKYYGDDVVIRHDARGKALYKTTAGGFRKSVGTGGQILGSGADIIICLRGDQKIRTDKGEIDIKEIVDNKLDVKLLTYNHDKKRNEYKKIIRYDKNKGKKLLKVRTLGGDIVCTEDHEIWTENRGHVMAKNLSNKDIVRHE